MSSRALRKLQREQDEKAHLAKALENHEESDEGGDENISAHDNGKPKMNAFGMLNAAQDESEHENEAQGSYKSGQSSEADKDSQSRQQHTGISQSKPQGQAQGKRKKKSRKKKQQEKKTEVQDIKVNIAGASGKKTDLDEIDLALLSLKNNGSDPNRQDGGTQEPSEEFQRLHRLLAIDTRSLNALNEMKKLFGSVVLEGENEDAGPPVHGRRRDRGRQRADLGAALAARNSPVSRGQGLAGLALRRNVFVMGKESWPKGTSGGLSMEVVEKADDQTTEYRFVHNSTYQDVQRQFHICTESLDPQRMIRFLQFNPYHISTLLVVSEIAEHQGDHSLGAEQLERALFSFGRSVHSSFHKALAEGKARFDFRRPENREFWLVVWRYITTLGQRGTWRTAYEWAKLLLSLDPEEDPFCIHLIIDQLALRGGQAEELAELVKTVQPLFAWGQDSPNLQISLSLAQYRLKQPELCRKTLTSAVKAYPWIFADLFQELNIEHIPKAIWGMAPGSARQKLEAEPYATRAKDLWNTPETISLLVEVVESVGGKVRIRYPDTPISKNEARHIMLSGIPSLISLLPREFTTTSSSSIDVLPPDDSISSYSIDLSEVETQEDDDEHDDIPPAEPALRNPTQQDQGLRGLQAMFSSFMPWLDPGFRRRPPNATEPEPRIDNENQAMIAASGLSPEALARNTERLFELHERYPSEDDADGAYDDEDDNEDEEMPDLESGSENMTREQEIDEEERQIREALAQSRNQLDQDTLQAVSQAVPTNDQAPARSSTEPYDDQRNQRWLAGQGMLALKDFVAEHGTDENIWLRDENINITPVAEYARRVKHLEFRATRNFIIDYVLQQGTSNEVRALILRIMEPTIDMQRLLRLRQSDGSGV